jgi:hypothetical protein
LNQAAFLIAFQDRIGYSPGMNGHKIKAFLFLSTFLLVSSVCQARLGESNAEIAKRYGAVQSREELGTNAWMASYLFKEYKIGVVYYTNVCVAEFVTPIEGRTFGDDERDALMKNIGGSGTWVKDGTKIEFLANSWINTTTKARARGETKMFGGDTLTVMSQVYIDRQIAEQKEKEKSKADGF